ncbi:hypothetical protein RFI_36283, partial [Reticulomyxa filosa]
MQNDSNERTVRNNTTATSNIPVHGAEHDTPMTDMSTSLQSQHDNTLSATEPVPSSLPTTDLDTQLSRASTLRVRRRREMENDSAFAELDEKIDNKEHDIAIPASKKQKLNNPPYQFITPTVPIPTENFGDQIYIILCRLISHCIQNGVSVGVPKVFHEFGVTEMFVESLIK